MPGWNRQFAGVVLACLLLYALAPAAVRAQSGDVSPERPAEYMIYQYPDVAMVVRIDLPQTAFHSEIFGADQALLISSSLPSARLGPIYQFVPAPDSARQLMIKVVPEQRVPRSRISLELIQLPATDPNNAALSQAYRLLSSGLQTVHGLDTSTWAMKTYTLRNAASVFAQLGWEEMRLWAEHFSAHLVLHRLNDEISALDLARQIQQQARRAGQEEILLAARVLESEALVRSATVSAGDARGTRYQQALDVLAEAGRMSGEQGLHAEQARAAFNRGLVFEELGQPERSVAQYQQALDIAMQYGESELANTIRGTAAEAYEIIGSTEGALGMLEEIQGDEAGGDDDELIRSLNEKGRLLNQDFRFSEASAVLDEALDLQRGDGSSANWTATALEKAWALYSLGYASQSAELSGRALSNARFEGMDAQLARAWGSLANTDRQNRDFGRMDSHRDRQAEFLGTAAEQSAFLLDRALDSWARGGDQADASRWLRRAAAVASESGLSRQQQRVALYGCLLAPGVEPFRCPPDRARQLAGELGSSGVPLWSVEAGWVLSLVLERSGRVAEAQAELESLIADIGFYRELLPGVLGAWYWENRAAIAGHYLDVMLQRSGVGERSFVDGSAVLAAFEWVRLLGSSMPPEGDRLTASVAGPEFSRLRTRISRLAESPSGQSAVSLNRDLAAARSAASGGDIEQPATPREVGRWIRGLSGDQVFLTYYFSGSEVYALLADNEAVRLKRLPQGQRINRQLSALRDEIQSSGQNSLAYLETLGQLMLSPLENELAETVFLLSTGPLQGLPLDAFRLRGSFFAERHRVMNVLSIDAAQRQLPRVASDFTDRVFLAGRPQDSQKLFEYDVQVAPEVARLTDRFVGPGLHIVQGVALQKDEFRDDNFSSASLIHLATPGTIDLRFPEQSRLRLSGTGDDPTRGLVYPPDIRMFPQAASLVTLSSVAARGENLSGFDSRIGLVSDFLEAGAKAVLASLWLQPQSSVADFMDDFYQRLSADPDALDVLVDVRRERIGSSPAEEFMTWAGFQLYIR